MFSIAPVEAGPARLPAQLAEPTPANAGLRCPVRWQDARSEKKSPGSNRRRPPIAAPRPETRAVLLRRPRSGIARISPGPHGTEAEPQLLRYESLPSALRVDLTLLLHFLQDLDQNLFQRNFRGDVQTFIQRTFAPENVEQLKPLFFL